MLLVCSIFHISTHRANLGHRLPNALLQLKSFRNESIIEQRFGIDSSRTDLFSLPQESLTLLTTVQKCLDRWKDWLSGKLVCEYVKSSFWNELHQLIQLVLTKKSGVFSLYLFTARLQARLPLPTVPDVAIPRRMTHFLHTRILVLVTDRQRCLWDICASMAKLMRDATAFIHRLLEGRLEHAGLQGISVPDRYSKCWFNFSHRTQG